MNVWYMYDNHTFTKFKDIRRDALLAKAKEVLAEDSCGSFFVRDEMGGTIDSLTLHTKQVRPYPDLKYGIPNDELERWADQIEIERSFRTLMV